MVALTAEEDQAAKGLELELHGWSKGARRVVLAGLGNPLRSDDAVGIRLVKWLRGRLPESVLLLECDQDPQALLPEVSEFRPTHVLLMDAACMGHEPGTVHLLHPSELPEVRPQSTHALPARILCSEIMALTQARLALLLVEPADTGFGEELSNEVQRAAQALGPSLVRVLG